MTMITKLLSRARQDDGFAMMLALSVLVVTSLLLVVAYTSVNGDTHTSRRDLVQKQAYYASLAGVQEFEYALQNNPDVWEECKVLSSKLPEEAGSHYKVEILPAASAPKGTTKCESTNPFNTAIETKEPEPNTFRIISTGCASAVESLTECPEANKSGKIESSTKVSVHQIVATFEVTGFLSYVYFTNHEDEDPALYNAPANCLKPTEYFPNTKNCNTITFASEDNVNGPMHTNDAVCMDKGATFGRENQTPADIVEFYRGLNTECQGGGVYNTPTKNYIKGVPLEPPESDSTLEAYALAENEFEGVTKVVLEGNKNEIKIVNKGVTIHKPWPLNGLLWIKGSPSISCDYEYEPLESDESEETSKETGCGNVYVEGNYSKSLTVASSDDVIINGNLIPTGLEPGQEPTGSATLGIIANHYVRIYHPVENGKFGCQNASSGDIKNPWIYAALLSTQHSVVVDNYNCGSPLGELNIYGAIAQNYRGIVATGNSKGVVTGYVKNYNYDDRLAVDEPPYFLAPLKAGWKVVRETTP
jgi:hypothetical protein